MVFNPDRAFDVDENGIGFLIDGVQRGLITAGDSSPVGNQAPLGSKYFQSNGREWKKVGTGANDWVLVDHLEIVSSYSNLPSSPFTSQSVIYTPFNQILTWDGNHWVGPGMGLLFGRNRKGQSHVWLQAAGKAAIYPRYLNGSVQLLGFYMHQVGAGCDWKIKSLTAESDQAITGDLEIHQGASSLIPT
jgi:hypothetical protein